MITDRDGSAIPPVEASSAVPQPTDTRPVTQAELDDILNDPALQPHERRARLEALAAAHGESASVERGEETNLFRIQIAEALGLLADGGHAYPAGSEPGPDGTERR